MSIELKDFRGKITPETDCVLETMSRVHGRDRSEVARDILHEWAVRQIHESVVLAQLLQANGISGKTGE